MPLILPGEGEGGHAGAVNDYSGSMAGVYGVKLNEAAAQTAVCQQPGFIAEPLLDRGAVTGAPWGAVALRGWTERRREHTAAFAGTSGSSRGHLSTPRWRG